MNRVQFKRELKIVRLKEIKNEFSFFLSLATYIVLKASYCISYLSDRKAREAQVLKLCVNVKERVLKKIFGGKKEEKKYGKGFRVVSQAHFLLSCLLVYRLYSSTAKNGWFFRVMESPQRKVMLRISKLLDLLHAGCSCISQGEKEARMYKMEHNICPG